jgi:hypothetical protein
MSTAKQTPPSTYFVREVALAFLGAGILIHLISAAMGLDFVRRYILTPKSDILLFGAILYSAVGLVLTWRRHDLSPLWKKISYVILILFCLAEIPVHVSIQASQSTEILKTVPPGYDYFIIPVLAYFTWMLLGLRRRQEA